MGDLLDSKDEFDALLSVLRTCRESLSSATERLAVLQIAWLAEAHEARSSALAFPGGFQMEQERQVDQLQKLLRLVQNDTPAVEWERLMLEGDAEGARRHLKKLSDDFGKGG